MPNTGTETAAEKQPFGLRLVLGVLC